MELLILIWLSLKKEQINPLLEQVTTQPKKGTKDHLSTILLEKDHSLRNNAISSCYTVRMVWLFSLFPSSDFTSETIGRIFRPKGFGKGTE